MKKIVYGAGSAALLMASQAHAALPEAVSTGITTAGADLVLLFGALTAAGITVFVARAIYKRFRV